MLRDRFAEGSSAAFDAINRSLPVDRAMAAQDVQGSMAHVRMLAAQAILTADEADELLSGLQQIDQALEDGLVPGSDDADDAEDIHLWVEQRLGALVGPVAGKLHTGRSRNDQVALDQRLALRMQIHAVRTQIGDVVRALATGARANLDVVLPFYTHLQRAQPVLLAHHLLAHAEAFRRDRERMLQCWERSDATCPLGAGAGAGTSYPIDPAATAELLGFAAPLRNSLDAVSARDHVLEFAAAATICAVHASRLAEELVLWSSAEFGFVRVSDGFASSSSIMPQKRNPDAAELTRAYAGRILGRFTGFAATLKNLPLAYNKDLQEATHTLFGVGQELATALGALAGMLAGVTFDAARMRAAVDDPRGFMLATDLADHLVRQGLAFREAHGQVAALVRWCEGASKGLGECTLAEIRAHCPAAADDVQQRLTIDAALASRSHVGGTAPDRVREALDALDAAVDGESDIDS